MICRPLYKFLGGGEVEARVGDGDSVLKRGVVEREGLVACL